MPAALTRERLATARIFVDRFSADSISLARWLRALGANVYVVDAGPIPPALAEACAALVRQGVTVAANTGPDAVASECDFIFADIFHPPTRPFIVEARRRGQPVTTLGDLILQFSPLPTLGVTGSAGKSSTTLLIHDALRRAGRTAHMGRDSVMENLWPNYEILDQLDGLKPPGWLLLELTSSHLEYMHASPHLAVVTVLWPDHVDWHGSAEAYLRAKRVIVEHQTAADWAIVNFDDAVIRERFEPACRAQVVHFSTRAEAPLGVFVRDGEIVARWNGESLPIMPVPEVPVAERYLGNIVAGAAAALVAGAPIEAIGHAIRHYRPLPHRLEFVAEVNGVRVVADGMAITPGKANAGISSFADGSLVLIAGGSATSDYSDGLHQSPEERAQVVAVCRTARRKARALVLFGEAASLLRPLLLAEGVAPESLHLAPTLDAATHRALELASPGETVLFAPIFFVEPDERNLLKTAVAAHLGGDGAAR
jgi:UDP-N-acetylmuramoylalanine--D-glutamate ligase